MSDGIIKLNYYSVIYGLLFIVAISLRSFKVKDGLFSIKYIGVYFSTSYKGM